MAVMKVAKQRIVTPPTPKSGQSRNSALSSNFILKKAEKQIAPCKTTAKEVSFKWSHYTILATDSKFRTTLYSIINSTTGKYCSVALIWMVTLKDFIHRVLS